MVLVSFPNHRLRRLFESRFSENMIARKKKEKRQSKSSAEYRFLPLDARQSTSSVPRLTIHNFFTTTGSRHYENIHGYELLLLL